MKKILNIMFLLTFCLCLGGCSREQRLTYEDEYFLYSYIINSHDENDDKLNEKQKEINLSAVCKRTALLNIIDIGFILFPVRLQKEIGDKYPLNYRCTNMQRKKYHPARADNGCRFSSPAPERLP